jgi:hypothetical protein
MDDHNVKLIDFISTLANRIPNSKWEKEELFNLKTGEHLLLRDYYKKNMKELFGVEVTFTNITKI